jgi:hypothetical protein
VLCGAASAIVLHLQGPHTPAVRTVGVRVCAPRSRALTVGDNLQGVSKHAELDLAPRGYWKSNAGVVVRLWSTKSARVPSRHGVARQARLCVFVAE